MRMCRDALPGCVVCVLVAGAALIARAAVAQLPATSQEPIVVNSTFSNIDYSTNTAAFTNIVVSQGGARLTAERAKATGVGFTDSEWTFMGQVVIVLEPRGSVRADQAVLHFSNGELVQVTAIGSPAYFDQQPADSSRPALPARPGHGHADQIIYDAKQDTVRLDGHAQLSNGRDEEMSAPAFVYHLRDERFQADSPGERRGVHMTVEPTVEAQQGRRGSGHTGPTGSRTSPQRP